MWNCFFTKHSLATFQIEMLKSIYEKYYMKVIDKYLETLYWQYLHNVDEWI